MWKLICRIVVFCIVLNLYAQDEVKILPCIIRDIIEVHELECKTEKNQSFILRLLDDSVLSSSDVRFKADRFYNKIDRGKYKVKLCDFYFESWGIQKNKEALLSSIGNSLCFTSYEKPPKVVLIKEDNLVVISTWGAVYRTDIYDLRDELINKYGYKEVKATFHDDSDSKEFEI